jgi:hypothetical protein
MQKSDLLKNIKVGSWGKPHAWPLNKNITHAILYVCDVGGLACIWDYPAG